MKPLQMLIPAAMLCTLAACHKDDNSGMTRQRVIKVENLLEAKPFVESGTFRGTGTPPLILPGQKTSFSFYAGKGQAVTFATMYGWSNDMFFAPANPGIALFDAGGQPVEGDVSNQVKLWDDGTKINQQPGMSNPHNSADENGLVKEINGTDAQGHTFLPADTLMRVTLKYEGDSRFTLTVENISGGTANETPFSPGVWAISNFVGGMPLSNAPLFSEGQKSANGLQPLSEMGNNTVLSKYLQDHTGIITALSPVLVVVYKGTDNPLFMKGEKDRGQGLSDIAQRGDPTALKAFLESRPGVRHVYLLQAPQTKLLFPGGSAWTTIEVRPQDKITFATMFGSSNDWFYSFGDQGVEGNRTGDLSDMVALWDDGTAIDQYPGAGNHQAGLGGNPKDAPESEGITEEVSKTYPVPPVKAVIRVTVSQ